ncbi:hypothetical protein [Elioraea rosea]|uniref:hypothetical protein n=1 Tax=Elioraea rosea TaxID=2492390 RepID=UPI001184E045|nr:hypothetical protein [Elioraea rosea]
MSGSTLRRGLIAAALAALLAGPAAGQEPRTVRIPPAEATAGARLTGTLHGDRDVRYLVTAEAGQRIAVSLEATNRSAYMNVSLAGAAEALHVGSMSGDRFQGVAPASGEYAILVYLMRNAARRNETSRYTLTVEVGGGAARRPDATGEIPCAGEAGQPSRACAFAVRREGAGKATVTVTLPSGAARQITFEGGKPVRSDAAAAVAHEMSADLFLIRIGVERFEIPEAVITGG